MTIKLRAVDEPFECDMCPRVVVAAWHVLANHGWLRHGLSDGRAITLCGSCAGVIAERRAAANAQAVADAASC